MSDDFVPLDKWPLLERDRIQHAVDMALGMISEGYYRQAQTIMVALSNRLKVDDAVIEFHQRHDELDGGNCDALHQ